MTWAIAAHFSPKNGRLHNSKFPSAGNVHGNKNYAFPQCKSCLHIADFHQPTQAHPAGVPCDSTSPLAWCVCPRRAEVPALFRVRVSPSVSQELYTRHRRFPRAGAYGASQVLRRLSSCMPRPEDSGGPPPPRHVGGIVLPSGAFKPSASAIAMSKLYQHFRVRGHPYGLQDTLSTLRPSCSPCLHGSAMDARLATGGWLALTRQGLAPCKRR